MGGTKTYESFAAVHSAHKRREVELHDTERSVEEEGDVCCQPKDGVG